jgi:hypothetical protein
MTPKLTPPGTKRLKFKRDILLQTSAFKFSLRCYSKGMEDKLRAAGPGKCCPPPHAFCSLVP